MTDKANVRDPLDAWLDEASTRCSAKGFPPGPVPAMLKTRGNVGAMEYMVTQTPLERTPLQRLIRAGLRDWTIEAGVLKFADQFKPHVRAAAKFRLDYAEGRFDD
jgi:hypothetical protein